MANCSWVIGKAEKSLVLVVLCGGRAGKKETFLR